MEDNTQALSVQDEQNMPSAREMAFYFDKQRLQQMLVMANEFYKASCFGADVKNAHQALVKIQTGYEMGMPPMEAMGSLYIVNGKVTIWGAAMSKRLRQKGWLIQYEDANGPDGKPASCKVTIKKGSEVHEYTAMASEVKNGKAFAFAPKDKLRWHALSRLIRFEVPEVLDAGIAYLKEEAEDIEPDYIQATATVVTQPTVDELLEAIKKAKDLAELAQVRLSIPSSLDREEQSIVRKALIAQETILGGQVSVPKDVTPEVEKNAAYQAAAYQDAGAGEVVNVVKARPTEVARDYPENAVPERPTAAEPIDNPPKKWKKAPAKPKNDHWTIEKVESLAQGLKLRSEVQGLKDEIVGLYLDGALTETVYIAGVKACDTRLQEIIAEAKSQKPEQSSLPE